MVHFDAKSVGVYDFPMGVVKVAPPPDEVRDPIVTGSIRDAEYQDGLLVCHGDLTTGDSLKRPTTEETTGEVLSWLRVSPRLAWSCLYNAIPDFWLNRFRRTTEWSQLADTDHALNLEPLTKKRRLQRSDLGHHALSLRSKIWALKHHRNGFRSAMTEYKEDRNRELALVMLTAEFCAHDAATYSLLEELARLLSLVTLISEGNATPTSFHDLHKGRDECADPELKALLDSLTWFEPFRLRRANSSHSFTAMLHAAPEGDGLVVGQRIDPRLRAGPREAPGAAAAAQETFQELVDGTERFTSDLSIYLLQKFTPYDLVTLQIASHDEPSEFRTVTVWVRRLIFDPALIDCRDGEAIVSADGSVRVRGTTEGGFSKVT